MIVQIAIAQNLQSGDGILRDKILGIFVRIYFLRINGNP
jgi:hypothetical protein